MEEFLIGAGLLLLLAVLAWSDQIRNFHRDTLKLEKEFSQKRGFDLRKIREVTRAKMEPAEQIVALKQLIKGHISKTAGDIDIINQLRSLDSDRFSIEKKHKLKYCLVIALTHLFWVSGIINYFIDDCSQFKLFCLTIKTEFITISICIIFMFVILYFVACLNIKENNYEDSLNNLMDKI